MRKFRLSSKGAVSLLIGAVLAFIAVSPAYATPDPNTQGGNTGVIYFTEMNEGKIYLGDFAGSTRSVFWSDPTSKVNEVAVTATRIAWSAYDNGALKGKIKISNVGSTAGTITTVTIPLNPTITSLTADAFGEQFYVTTDLGDIWRISSDGQTQTKMLDGAVQTAVGDIVRDVYWGSWFDSYSSTYYFCPWSGMSAHRKQVMKATVSGSAMSVPTALKVNANTEVQVDNCDGLGIDPATQELFALSSASPYDWSRIAPATSPYWTKTSVTTFTDVNSSPITRAGAPSSMFVSHSTGKMYFATETDLYETNFDGTNTRTIYLGNNIQNIAVYYGATTSTIDAVVQSLLPQQPSTPASNSSSSAEPASLASTGSSNTALYGNAGALALIIMALGGIMVAARKFAKK